MKPVCVFVAGALAFAVLAAPAHAQDYRPDEVVRSVGTDDLTAVIASLGHQVLDQGGREGELDPVMAMAETPDELRYVLLGTACNANGVAGCQGVLMQAQFDIPPGTTYETVVAANREFAALNIWVDFTQKSLGFTRYVVVDRGVTMANLRENVLVLIGLVGNAFPVAAGEESAPSGGV